MLAPIAPCWRPRRRTSPSPSVLPPLSSSVPTAFLGVRHLMVSQRLGSWTERGGVDSGRSSHDESRCPERRDDMLYSEFSGTRFRPETQRPALGFHATCVAEGKPLRRPQGGLCRLRWPATRATWSSGASCCRLALQSPL